MTISPKTGLAALTALGLSACSEPGDAPHSVDFGDAAPIDWVALAGACLTVGETQGYAEERPVTEVCVEGFSISRHEVTTAQFAAFVTATGYVTDAERAGASAVFDPVDGVAQNLNWWRLEPGAHWRWPQGPGAEPANPSAPVVHVTQADANAFAAWAGGRLPTENEWEYAARGGPEGTLFTFEEAEAAALSGKANTWQGLFPVIDIADDGYGGIAPVGQFPADGHGLYDMIGNVWELTSTAYFPTREPDARDQAVRPHGHDPTQPGRAVAVIKGGSFLCSRSYCYRFRPAARQAQDRALSTSHIGFRIVTEMPL